MSIGALCCCAVGVYAEEGRCAPVDERAVRQVAEDWRKGYNAGDAAKVAGLYAVDAYYLTQHFVSGILHGREEMKAYVQRGIDAKYRIDSIEVITASCSADLAYTVGRYLATNGGEKAMGVNLVVLRRVAGKWMIVAHEAAVPDPATAVKSLGR